MQWRNELSTCNGQAEHVQWYKRKALFLIPDPLRLVVKSVHGLSQACVLGRMQLLMKREKCLAETLKKMVRLDWANQLLASLQWQTGVKSTTTEFIRAIKFHKSDERWPL